MSKINPNPNNRTANNIHGFTLIEIMVVVFILGILATFVVPAVLSRPDEARKVKAQQDIRAIEGSLQLYKLDNFVYPTSNQGLKALSTKPEGGNTRLWKKGGYMNRIPKDPWGNDYQYVNPGVNGIIDIFSFGADGTQGGEDNNADIGNWNAETAN